MNKAPLILFFVFLLVASSALGMVITHPQESVVYRSSVMALNYSDNLTGSKVCYYNLGDGNISLVNCTDQVIEFPINNGTINLTVYERNATVQRQDSINVTIQNEFTTAKAILIFGFLLLFLALAFVFWYPCFKLDYLHTPIKLFLTLLGFFCGLVFLSLGAILTESYVHNEAILSFFTSMGEGYRWVFYSIALYFVITFLFSIFEGIKKGGQPRA